MDKVDLMEKKNFRKIKKKNNSQNNIPLVLTYNRTLSNIEVISKNWYILQINSSFRYVFDNKPKIAYKRNKNRQELIVNKVINKTWKYFKKEIEKRQGKNKTFNITR